MEPIFKGMVAASVFVIAFSSLAVAFNSSFIRHDLQNCIAQEPPTKQIEGGK